MQNSLPLFMDTSVVVLFLMIYRRFYTLSGRAPRKSNFGFCQAYLRFRTASPRLRVHRIRSASILHPQQVLRICDFSFVQGRFCPIEKVRHHLDGYAMCRHNLENHLIFFVSSRPLSVTLLCPRQTDFGIFLSQKVLQLPGRL